MTQVCEIRPRWQVPVPGEEELVQQHTGLVRAILQRDFAGLPIEYDDALQIGLMALLKAIRTYEPDKGAALATWAVTNIRSDLLGAYRHLQAQKRKADRAPISLDAPISEEDDRGLQVADPGQDPEREAVSRVQVERLLKRIRGKDRDIVEMMLAGKTVTEISERTGLSRHVIDERIKKMRAIVQEEKPVGKESNNRVNSSLSDMNEFLFAQMKRLGDNQLTGDALREEVMRSKAMADVATRIIQSGELVLRAHTFRDRQVDASEKLPGLLAGDE